MSSTILTYLALLVVSVLLIVVAVRALGRANKAARLRMQASAAEAAELRARLIAELPERLGAFAEKYRALKALRGQAGCAFFLDELMSSAQTSFRAARNYERLQQPDRVVDRLSDAEAYLDEAQRAFDESICDKASDKILSAT